MANYNFALYHKPRSCSKYMKLLACKITEHIGDQEALEGVKNKIQDEICHEEGLYISLMVVPDSS